MTGFEIIIIAVFISQTICNIALLKLYKDFEEDVEISKKCLWQAVNRIGDESDNLRSRVWNLEHQEGEQESE